MFGSNILNVPHFCQVKTGVIKSNLQCICLKLIFVILFNKSSFFQSFAQSNYTLKKKNVFYCYLIFSGYFNWLRFDINYKLLQTKH